MKPVQVQLSALFHSNITSNTISFVSSSSVVRTLVKATFQSYSTAIENGDGPRFAYGDSNFQDIRHSKSFYVDKTRFICELHKMMYEVVIMHRPPRFGKSLFLSTLQAYYDKAISKEEREKLFEGLHISKNSVPGAGEYYVFHLDLSVNIDGDENTMIANLHKTIDESILRFTSKYQIPISDKLQVGCVLRDSNSLLSFRSLCSWLTLRSLPLFVLVDEYDRFANKLLFENPKMYKTVVAGESGVGGSSFLRSLFETFKWASNQFPTKVNTQYPAFRLFAVGLCPLALADASEANIFKDITHEPAFADMVGFKLDDLKVAFELLSQTGKVKPHQVPRLLEMMKRFYNGYKFHYKQQDRLYNPTLSLHFLSLCLKGSAYELLKLRLPGNAEIIEAASKNEMRFPGMNLVNDRNVKISENVLSVLAKNRLTSGLFTQLQSGPVKLTSDILQEFTTSELFDASENTELTLLSLMFYHGVVTFGDSSKVPGNLQVPNYLVRVQILNRINSKVRDHLSRFVQTFDPNDLKDALQTECLMFNPMEDSFNETSLKMLTIGIVSGLKNLYLGLQVYSEVHIEEGNPFSKRIDLQIITPENRSIFIEFKVLMPHSLGLDHLNLKSEKAKKTTHFWTIKEKIQVHKYLKELSRRDLLALQTKANGIATGNDIEKVFRQGKEQVLEYGKEHIQKLKSQNILYQQPPVLFLASAVWNLHLDIVKVEFEEK